MNNFFYRNRHKFILIALCGILLVGLSSCRWSLPAQTPDWYNKAYTTFGDEWIDLWDNGRGFWYTLWAWPITILSYPIAWLCSTIGKGLGNSYFFGILFTTLIVRTIAWPIYSKQNESSLKMQLMQPEMAKVQAKYQGRTDKRSQQMMQQEMQKLYKKHGMNPAGCLITMCLQFPIFMAMYEVVRRINQPVTVIENGISITYAGRFALENTKLFGFFELNSSWFEASWDQWQDKIFCAVIALLFIGVSVLQQYLAQRPAKYQKVHPQDKNKKNANQNQMKMMMVIMNVMFGFMVLQSTSLGIYWLIGGIYQLFQSQVGRWMNNRKYEKMKQKELE